MRNADGCGGGRTRAALPELVGLPIAAGNAQIVQFIKDVYLDSQVTVGLLSNVTASSVTIGAEARRAPKNVQEALKGEILTAAQTVAARDFVNREEPLTNLLEVMKHLMAHNGHMKTAIIP